MATSKKPAVEIEQPTFAEPRGFFLNAKIILQSFTNFVASLTDAGSNGAESLNALARAGRVMAESVEDLTVIRTKGKHETELTKLKDQFPDIQL